MLAKQLEYSPRTCESTRVAWELDAQHLPIICRIICLAMLPVRLLRRIRRHSKVRAGTMPSWLFGKSLKASWFDFSCLQSKSPAQIWPQFWKDISLLCLQGNECKLKTCSIEKPGMRRRGAPPSSSTPEEAAQHNPIGRAPALAGSRTISHLKYARQSESSSIEATQEEGSQVRSRTRNCAIPHRKESTLTDGNNEAHSSSDVPLDAQISMDQFRGDTLSRAGDFTVLNPGSATPSSILKSQLPRITARKRISHGKMAAKPRRNSSVSDGGSSCVLGNPTQYSDCDEDFGRISDRHGRRRNQSADSFVDPSANSIGSYTNRGWAKAGAVPSGDWSRMHSKHDDNDWTAGRSWSGSGSLYGGQSDPIKPKETKKIP